MTQGPGFFKDADKVYKWLFILICLVGVVLRLHQHFLGRPLWEDEAHISMNFIYYGYKDLLKPLAYWQSAPILFLFSVETFTRLFGFSEVALRGFPLVVSLMTLPIFYFFVRDLTKSRLTAIIAFAIFACNAFIIRYSSEVKPYILELDAYILIGFLLVSKHHFVQKHRNLLLILVGSLSVFYANAANMILLCGVFYLISSWRVNKTKTERSNFVIEIPRVHLLVFLIWFGVLGINYFIFIYNHPYAYGMKEFWHFAFVPQDVFSEEFKEFMNLRTDELFFKSMLQFSSKMLFPYVVGGLLIIAALYIIIKRKAGLFALLILPLIVHFFMSMAKVYPIYYRLILYLMPALIILVSISVAQIAIYAKKKVHVAVSAILVFYFMFSTIPSSLKAFPYDGRNVKPCLNFINNKPLDMTVYITTPWTIYEYYQRRGKAKNQNTFSLDWNINPDRYHEIMANEKEEYLLLCSTYGSADGYAAVLEDLKKRNLIVEQMDFGTYTVMHVLPF